MEKLFSMVRAILLALLCFVNRGSGTEDVELMFPEFEEFQSAKEVALAINDLPLNLRTVQWLLRFDPRQGKEERIAKIYVDIDSPTKNFRLSLSLMRMSCDKMTGLSHLLITSDDGSGMWNTTWCDNVKYNKHNVAEGFTVQGGTSYTATVIGDWANTEAYVLATIYYEVSSCDSCDTSFFCCKDDKCAQPNTYQPRCISKSLKCNEFPNCGMICNNSDEERDANFGFPCGFNMWSLVWMISMGLTFFILIPAIIVILFCYHRQLSRERRNRPHPDPARRWRRNNDVVVNSPPDDLPPTYDDVHDTKEPPPGFTTVISSTSEGIHNPAMVQDDEHDSPIMHSMQSKSLPSKVEVKSDLQ